MDDQIATRALVEALYPLMRRVNAERKLSPGKVGVLRHLAEQGKATASELAVIVRVSPQGISLATRELEQLGAVRRVPDVEDRRRVWLEITEAGKQQLHGDLSSGQQWLDRAIAERLTPAERQTLEAAIPALEKLTGESAHE